MAAHQDHVVWGQEAPEGETAGYTNIATYLQLRKVTVVGGRGQRDSEGVPSAMLGFPMAVSP